MFLLVCQWILLKHIKWNIVMDWIGHGDIKYSSLPQCWITVTFNFGLSYYYDFLKNSASDDYSKGML